MPATFLRLSFIYLSLGLFLSSNQAHASCGTTSCSVNTNWNEHGSNRQGWSTDLRYSYSNADTLRSGNNKITADPTAAPYKGGIEAENLRTLNQLITATLDYSHDEHWSVMLELPYVMREHTHSIGEPNPALVTTEKFTANALGDIKVVGRYRFDTYAEMGIKFGLKLDTGRKDFLLNTGALPGEAPCNPEMAAQI